MSFQLTASQGGWQPVHYFCFILTIFQLTASQGGWQRAKYVGEVIQDISTHSLTRRLTFRLIRGYITGGYFNSQPHKEADDDIEKSKAAPYISTHSLTRRLTSSSSMRRKSISFQLTASQGGWLLLWYAPVYPEYFNSQPHKEADNAKTISNNYGEIFQLTASQGGWHKLTEIKSGFSSFQLTASQGGWRRGNLATCRVLQPFQLTASQGGWQSTTS